MQKKYWTKIFVPIVLVFFIQEIQAADTLLTDLITLPNNIKTIASDSAGTIWITGARGLQYYDAKKEGFVTVDPSNKGYIISHQGEVIDIEEFL